MNKKIFELRAPLIGGDISHHNYPFSQYFGDFMIHKATEGSTYVDPRWDAWVENRCFYTDILGENQVLNGSYHFMSTKSDPYDQAMFYCDHVYASDIDQIIILDLEQDALDKAIADPDFGLRWLSQVQCNLKTTPFIYTNIYGMNHLAKEYANYPLWLASRNRKSVETSGVFKDKAIYMWQFTEMPFDLNIFNGTAGAWRQMSWKH